MAADFTAFKVWVEIEGMTDRGDHETLDSPGSSLATFPTYEAAREFAGTVQAFGESGGLMADTERHTCGDCAVAEGELHSMGCDQERCAICHGQAISCRCIYTELGIDCSPGTQVYEEGPTTAMHDAFDALVDQKHGGRIPFILWPNICARCGERWPDIWMVPDHVWKMVSRTVSSHDRDPLVCRGCFNAMMEFLGESHRAPEPEICPLTGPGRWPTPKKED